MNTDEEYTYKLLWDIFYFFKPTPVNIELYFSMFLSPKNEGSYIN